MPFRDLVNQQHAQIILRGALRSGHVSHAYLFVGPSGVGRTAAARAFAQALLCVTGADDACGECHACRRVAAGTHPDLRIISPGKSETGAERRAVGIDQVRDLKHEAGYPPYEAKWKVFIVEDADAMRAEAANSLLKVLEEPPQGMVIILIAESASAVFPTLVSRSQVVRFNFVSAPEIAQALVERAGIPAERARYLAALAGGRMGVALQAATAGEEPFARRAEVVRALREIERGDIVTRLDAAEAVSRQKDGVEPWLDIAELWFRDLLVWQETQDPALLVNLDARREIAEWAGRASPDGIRRAIEGIEEAKAHLGRNLNSRLVLESLFARLDTRARAGRPGP
jgi:DNA polymerase III subunit delta'